MANIHIEIESSPYKIYTTAQIKQMTKRSESQINQMINRLNENETTQLDHCYPFPISNELKHTKTGPRLIVGNSKLAKFIDYCKRNRL